MKQSAFAIKSSQFFGLLLRETHRFFKVPMQTIGTPIVSTILYILIFGITLGTSISLPSHIPYLAFLIPGMISMTLIRNSYENSASCIIAAKYVNEMQDLRSTPLSIHQIIWAKSISSLIRGHIVGFLAYLVGIIFCYYQETFFLNIKHPGLFFFFTIFGALSYANLGSFIATWSKSFEQINGFNTFILTPLIYLGGVFFTLRSLHPIWQKISLINPLFYMINGVRYSMIEVMDMPLQSAVIFTILTFFVTYALAYYALKKGSNYTR